MASSLEAKIWASRMRFLGFAFLSPAGLLFFSYVLKRWEWLQHPFVRMLIFLPGLGTALITLGFFDPNLLVYDHAPFDYLGVSVLTFKNGPWFPVHYLWSNLITFSVVAMLVYSAIFDADKRKDIFFLSLGILAGSAVDLYSVSSNSFLRWMMLSAGTFSISELAILYVSKKNDLFGLLTFEKIKHAQLLENLEFHKRLLTLVTHDLSGNIRNQARIAQMLKKRLQENHHEIVDALAFSSKASDELIGNIMGWVKSQNGQFKPQIALVDLQNLFSDCVKTLQASHSDRRVEIKLAMPKNPFQINCDAEMLACILRNLFSNALNATSDESEIFLKVTEQGNFVHFVVDDKGKGMSADQLESLRGDKNLKKRLNETGYGVGLLLARHFVELHQGSLEISSVENQGTQVQFTILR